MLKTLAVKGFKSLVDTGPIEFAPLTVLFGPNAAGKSNFLDAVQVLSRLASERTLADALATPMRGLPIEAFQFPDAGLPALLTVQRASFAMEACVDGHDGSLVYRIEVALTPSDGSLTVANEYLTRLDRLGQPRKPRIERVDDNLLLRRKSRPGAPVRHDLGLSYTLLSDRRFSGQEYAALQRAREELSSWRTYYLDPRIAMRAQQAPQEVDDIGAQGEYLAPYLYRLKAQQPKAFAAVRRTLRVLVPSIEDLDVDLDPRRGVLDIEIRQAGTSFSSRIVSEGTLRVLALVCLAVNPWGGALIAFEEPENGIHPRRIELIAQMLVSLATEGELRRQVVVTTHSPVFCGAVLRFARALYDRSPNDPAQIRIYRVVRDGRETVIREFAPAGPLFEDAEIREGLSEPVEDAVITGLLLRGLLDG